MRLRPQPRKTPGLDHVARALAFSPHVALSLALFFLPPPFSLVHLISPPLPVEHRLPFPVARFFFASLIESFHDRQPSPFLLLFSHTRAHSHSHSRPLPPPSLLRALYERVAEGQLDLSFKKDDILYVDDSLPKGCFGTWMAWQLDENAQKIQRGQIPSKYM